MALGYRTDRIAKQKWHPGDVGLRNALPFRKTFNRKVLPLSLHGPKKIRIKQNSRLRLPWKLLRALCSQSCSIYKPCQFASPCRSRKVGVTNKVGRLRECPQSSTKFTEKGHSLTRCFRWEFSTMTFQRTIQGHNSTEHTTAEHMIIIPSGVG